MWGCSVTGWEYKCVTLKWSSLFQSKVLSLEICEDKLQLLSCSWTNSNPDSRMNFVEKIKKIKGWWHVEKRTKGKRAHCERPRSAFRNVSGSGWWAVSVVRSLQLPPSLRGPREERGVKRETGSPEPGFHWLRWTVFGRDSPTCPQSVYVWSWPSSYICGTLSSLHPVGWCSDSDGYDRGSWSCWINLQWLMFCRNVRFMNSFQHYMLKLEGL